MPRDDAAPLLPPFLTSADHPWLRDLIDAHDRHVGRRWAELTEHLRWTGADPQLRDARELARKTLEGLYSTRLRPCVSPRLVRARLFQAAAARPAFDRRAVLAAVASELGVEKGELERAMFADLARERLVTAPEEPLSPAELALRTNLALAQRYLKRADAVRIRLEGNARAVVRLAHLRGLICTVHASHARRGDAVELRLSGPHALFRRTRVYGRALARLLPALAWCKRFELGARCVVAGAPREVLLRSGDPIFVGDEPRRFDSRVEERFFRDFGRHAPHWQIVREPQALHARDRLVFPDFALVHREDPARRWLLEIVGFWTAEYLRHKLADYRAADAPHLILAIDAERDCGDAEIPLHAHVVRYRRRIDPARVLAILEPRSSST